VPNVLSMCARLYVGILVGLMTNSFTEMYDNRRTEPECGNLSHSMQSLWCTVFRLSLWSNHVWRLQG